MLIHVRSRTHRTAFAAVLVAIATILSFVPIGRASAEGLKPSLISGVQPVMGGTTLTVKTTYTGSGPLVLTVGTSFDVDRDKVSEAIATKVSGSNWSATARGLTPNTPYRFRLRAWDTSDDHSQTYLWTLRRRNVTVDFKTIWLVDDGDAWPKGCGEMIFTFKADARKKNTQETCLYSGDMYSPPQDSYRAGHIELTNQNYGNSVAVSIKAMDMDWGVVDSDCPNYNWDDPDCGDLALKNGLIQLKDGTTTYGWHLDGALGTTEAWVWFTVAVTYHA